nr:hypothetical protein [uncultured Actinotalea sp.]
MPAEITNHGQPGYRRGCRCEVCRRGHREHNAAWRAAKRQREQPAPASAPPVDAPLREPVQAMGALDLDREPGGIEQALLDDISAPDRQVAWKRTLVGMGRLNARLLDQVSELDRLDLISPVQLRLLEILNRLALIGFAGASDDGGEGDGVAAQMQQMLEEMRAGGDGAGGR